MQGRLQRRDREMIARDERVRVRADSEERRVAKVEQPGHADDDIEPEREQHVDAGVAGDREQEVWAAAGDDAREEREKDREDREEEVDDGVRVLPRIVLPHPPEPADYVTSPGPACRGCPSDGIRGP